MRKPKTWLYIGPGGESHWTNSRFRDPADIVLVDTEHLYVYVWRNPLNKKYRTHPTFFIHRDLIDDDD